jgi:hypothetical protein
MVGQLSFDLASMCCGAPTRTGVIVAKRKQGSKVQRRGKLPRGKSATRGKVRKVAKAPKRTVANAKPKRAPVKKAARKERMKQHVTPVVEIVAAEVIEQPAPNVITVTEVEETRKAS